MTVDAPRSSTIAGDVGRPPNGPDGTAAGGPVGRADWGWEAGRAGGSSGRGLPIGSALAASDLISDTVTLSQGRDGPVLKVIGREVRKKRRA